METIWFLRSSLPRMNSYKSVKFFFVLPPMKCVASTLVRGRVEPLLVAILIFNFNLSLQDPT